jgi:hypothetical protein
VKFLFTRVFNPTDGEEMTTKYMATQVLGEAGIEALRQLQRKSNQTGDFDAVRVSKLQRSLSSCGFGNVNVPSLGAQLSSLGYASWRDTGEADDLWGLAVTPEGAQFLKDWEALTK